MTQSPTVQDLGWGVHLIDSMLAGQPGMVGVFVHELRDGSVALIEASSGATKRTVQDALASLGISPDDVTGILLTHIHLDHAAGAGELAAWADCPVFVHPVGVPHLVDPSRLWRSAERIYGDAMTPLWGSMRPIDAGRIHATEDGTPIRIGGTQFEVLHVPGHANHHITLQTADGGMYVGDAAGILLPNIPLVRPALPPPETDLEAAERSLERIAERNPSRLLLTHFGEVAGEPAVSDHLRLVRERNRAWAEEVKRGIDAHEDEKALIARVARMEDQELDDASIMGVARARYKASSDAKMTVMGLQRYWKKRAAGESPSGHA